MGISSHRQIRCDLCLLARFYVLLAEISAIAQESLNLAEILRKLIYGVEHRLDLVLVVGVLHYVCTYDELPIRRHGGLCVVSLYESVGCWHDARFLVGEVDLRFRIHIQAEKLRLTSACLPAGFFFACFAALHALIILCFEFGMTL